MLDRGLGMKLYRRSGNFHVVKFSYFLCKNIFVVLDTHDNFLMVLNQYYVPRFSDLERDYASQENVEYEQLAAFMATQLLANSTHVRKRAEESSRHVLWQ